MGIFLGLAAVDAILYPYYNQQSKKCLQKSPNRFKALYMHYGGESDWIEQKYAEMFSFTFLVLRSQTLTHTGKVNICSPSFT